MRILFATTALVALGAAGGVQAQTQGTPELDALKAQIQLLQARLDALERQVAAPIAATAPTVAPAPIQTLPATAATPKPSAEPVRWENSPRFNGASGATFKLRGRLLIDAVDLTTERDGLADYHARQLKAR